MSIHTVALGSKLGHQFFGSAQHLTIFESYMLSESLRASQDDRRIHLIFIKRIQMRWGPLLVHTLIDRSFSHGCSLPFQRVERFILHTGILCTLAELRIVIKISHWLLKVCSHNRVVLAWISNVEEGTTLGIDLKNVFLEALQAHHGVLLLLWRV